jgi:phosphopantothenoylcysteine synthetase/decarboxylase
MSDAPILGLIASAAGGVENLRSRLIEPLVSKGWRVAVTLTPTAAEWLRPTGEVDALESLTDLPVRWMPRLPIQPRPHPIMDVCAVVPATANTVAELALGIGDTQALTTVGEAIGNPSTPVIVFPRINTAHARHPAWPSHLQSLREADVHLVYGDHIWPLHEPRSEAGRELPWDSILQAIEAVRPKQ